MRPSLSYILYTTSDHEQTGNIITFEQFEEGNLVENERNAEKYESHLFSINDLYTYDDSDNGSISKSAIEEI